MIVMSEFFYDSMFPAHYKFSSIGKYYIANYKEITRDRNLSMRNRKKQTEEGFWWGRLPKHEMQ